MQMSRYLGATSMTTRSSNTTRPSLIDSRPAMQRRAVVLPQPDGPTRTRNSPSAICRFRSLTAWTSAENRFVTWSKVTVAIWILLVSPTARGHHSAGALSRQARSLDTCSVGGGPHDHAAGDHAGDEPEEGCRALRAGTAHRGHHVVDQLQPDDHVAEPGDGGD